MVAIWCAMYIGTYHKLKPIDDRVDRFTGNLMDTAILLEDAIKAVEDEPELPGQMPDEMWAMINGDRDAIEELLRITVRQTKSGIIERLTPNKNVSISGETDD